MEVARSIEYKIICVKQGMCLEKAKHCSNNFRLSFISPCSLERIKTITMQGFYQLLAKLNPDIIQNLSVSSNSPSHQTVELIFVSFAKELGMTPKTMQLELQNFSTDTSISFRGQSPKEIAKNNVICEQSEFNATSSESGHTNICYQFHLDFQEDLPIYLQDIPGLLMKKMFFRLKQYLES